MSATVTLTPEHTERDAKIRQAPEEHHPRLVTVKDVRAGMHGSHAMGRFNNRLAVLITKSVGTMWCAYIFTLIAIGGGVAVLTNNAFLTAVSVLVSQTFLQLVLLPVIIVGQNVISAAQDARAEADHDTLIALHEMSKQQIKILEGQNKILDLLQESAVKRGA
jgi:hypothetical protein